MGPAGWTAVLLSSWIVAAVSPQTLPQTPCPSVFQYQKDGQRWMGLLQVPAPPSGSALRLDLETSIGVPLPTKYVGYLELLEGTTETVRQLMRGGVVRYRVHFPLFNPLPQVTAITFNGNLICQGPPATSESDDRIVTKINMMHELHTSDFSNSLRRPVEEVLVRYTSPRTPYKAEEVPFRYTSPRIPFKADEVPFRYTSPRIPYGAEEVPVRYTSPRIPYKAEEVPFRYTSPRIPYKEEEVPFRYTSPRIPYKAEEVPFRYTSPRIPYKAEEVPVRYTSPRTPYKADEETTVRHQQSCGVVGQRTNPLIVGGEFTSRGDWPWLVALFVSKVLSLEFTCAGTLISDRHIVTAAHCVYSKENGALAVNELLAKVGIFNLQDWTDENVRTLTLSQIFLHPDFNSTQLYEDIAILLTSKTVTFTQYISAICLWEGDSDLTNVVGQKGVVVGWGRDENGLKVTPEPRRADITIVSTDTCRASRTEFQTLTNSKTLCAGDRNGTGPCSGDSGGGLFLNRKGRWMLRGVVSTSLIDYRSTNLCNLNEFIIFTDVAKYFTWVKSVLAAS